jgi:hypothetical protein
MTRPVREHDAALDLSPLAPNARLSRVLKGGLSKATVTIRHPPPTWRCPAVEALIRARPSVRVSMVRHGVVLSVTRPALGLSSPATPAPNARLVHVETIEGRPVKGRGSIRVATAHLAAAPTAAPGRRRLVPVRARPPATAAAAAARRSGLDSSIVPPAPPLPRS